MTRFSEVYSRIPCAFVIVAALTGFTPKAGLAEDVYTDAFGIIPHYAVSDNRSRWDSGLPQEASDQGPILSLYVAPKSLAAGGASGQATAVVMDETGTMVRDGTRVAFFREGVEIGAVATSNGIASLPLEAGIAADSFAVGAVSLGNQSQRATYRITPDVASLTAELLPQVQATSFEKVTTIETGAILDRFGNVVDEGTAARIVLHHSPNRFTLLPTHTLRGSAGTYYLVRDVPPSAEAQVSIAGKRSPTQPVNAVPIELEADLPVQLQIQPDLRALLLKAGPFQTAAGHQLTDGSEVFVSVEDRAGNIRRHSGWVRDGVYATFITLDPRLSPFSVTVETQAVRFDFTGVEPVNEPVERLQ